MQKLGCYIDGALKSLKAEHAIRFHKLKLAWWNSVGPIIANQTEPIKIQGTTLYVLASSPAWSQEVSLHQQLIISRLKKALKHPPQRIICWVGNPKQQELNLEKNSKQAYDRSAPWLNQPISKDHSEYINSIIVELNEPTLKQKVRSLVELSVRKEQYLLELGHLPCPSCGSMRPPHRDKCRTCAREQKAETEKKIMRFMSLKPWASMQEFKDYAPWVKRDELYRLKKKLHSDLLLQVWQLTQGLETPEVAKNMTFQLAALMQKVTMLACGVPRGSLRPNHFLYALGKRLGQAYILTTHQQS